MWFQIPCYAKYLTSQHWYYDVHGRYFAMRSIWFCTCGTVMLYVRHFAMWSIWLPKIGTIMFMSDTSLCEVFDAVLVVLWCFMSDTSLCEVSDFPGIGTMMFMSDASLCEVSDFVLVVLWSFMSDTSLNSDFQTLVPWCLCQIFRHGQILRYAKYLILYSWCCDA